MKILTNRKIKRLFCRVLLSLILFTLISVSCTLLQLKHAALYVLLSCAGMGLSILAFLYLYFREQDRIMEEAAAQIRNYLSGDKDARISCDEEGGLYRLFHEVNSLVAILNAHAENEAQAKRFMKDTLSDISHQLKTPVAALNIYNGILQAEAGDAGNTGIHGTVGAGARSDGNLVQNLLKSQSWTRAPSFWKSGGKRLGHDVQIEEAFRLSDWPGGQNLSLSGDESMTLFCDRTWLTEAVSNLVKNAFDHTRKAMRDSVQ